MYSDQFYQDQTGALHFLSATDQANAVASGLDLPRVDWVPITNAQAQAIQNPKPTLAQVKAAQLAAVSGACASELLQGFSSSALGATHTYPSLEADQRNLMNAAMASQEQTSTWSTSLWCATGEAWAFTAHSSAQLQQVNADWLAHRQARQQKYADLVDKINAATSVTAVQAITW